MIGVQKILQEYWGYDSFRPLQREAMDAIAAARDSVVILPTGGGKSLCFQAPALRTDGLVVVVSPLISLMKDQVDALRDRGIAASCINSALTEEERDAVFRELHDGTLKLLYVAPERLVTTRFLRMLRDLQVAYFVVDEAHCISAWGHDFRPEYRALDVLKREFPDAHVHAYTATATEHVRKDIATELGLDNPEVLVGSFDRPNLTYRFQRRQNLRKQIMDVIQQHPGASGIVYCLRRADVDHVCAQLRAEGVKALPYHAGMSERDRKDNQEAFMAEEVDVIVATVAFGMGIDKSNVRYVIHAAMPKSLEHYQQESGRAGRDNLPSDCYLFYGGDDFGIWRHLLRDLEPETQQIALEKLSSFYTVCTGTTCRHKAILAYFGEAYEKESCKACDVCLDGLELVDDPVTLGQKILSAVLRLNQRFGAAYVTLVLKGSSEQRVLENRHDQLSTWGLLKKHADKDIRNWIDQLVEQAYLRREGEYNLLLLTERGNALLRGEGSPKLLKPYVPKEKTAKPKAAAAGDMDPMDEALFDHLRDVRRKEAKARKLKPYMIFGDVTLIDMAVKKPLRKETFKGLSGVGAVKCKQYWRIFTTAILEFCADHSIDVQETVMPVQDELEELPSPTRKNAARANPAKDQAWALFDDQASLEDVVRHVGRTPVTVCKYLVEYIQEHALTDPYPWATETDLDRVATAVGTVGSGRLRSIYDFLNEEIAYEVIHVALACLRNRGEKV